MESLTQLLRLYQRRPNTNTVSQILSALAEAQVLVPVSNEGSAGLKPDVIALPDGKHLYPLFTTQEQVPNDYGEKFSFLRVPFPEYCRTTQTDPDFAGLVLDPFTAKFLMPDSVARNFSASMGMNQ